MNLRKKVQRLIAVVFVLSAWSASTFAQAVITGTWKRGYTKEVSLYRILSGRMEVLSTYNLQEDKAFAFAVSPTQEEYYVVGSGHVQAATDKYVFYLKPKDRLHVEVNDSSYTLAGKNSVENEALTAWHDWKYPLELKAVYFMKTVSNYVDFFPDLDKMAATPFVAKKTGNKLFDQSFNRFREIDLLYTAMHFLHTPRSAHPENEDYSSFYRNISIPNLTADGFLLQYPLGVKLLSSVSSLNHRLAGNDYATHNELDILPQIQNEALKGEILMEKVQRIKTYDGYKELMATNQQYITTDDQKRRISEIVTKLAEKENQPGKAAVNFTHQDVNGKDVSLSDFKGKVVVVDVWATWCGPCIKEIPALQKLEKEYHGKDVVFMGVSVDEEKDREKWKKFLVDKEMKGVQLFAGGWKSDIAKFYQIKSIPRFMVFGKNGEVVSTEAPRPSSSEMKLMIDKELKK